MLVVAVLEVIIFTTFSIFPRRLPDVQISLWHFAKERSPSQTARPQRSGHLTADAHIGHTAFPARGIGRVNSTTSIEMETFAK
jgi:hypothetical protein